MVLETPTRFSSWTCRTPRSQRELRRSTPQAAAATRSCPTAPPSPPRRKEVDLQLVGRYGIGKTWRRRLCRVSFSSWFRGARANVWGSARACDSRYSTKGAFSTWFPSARYVPTGVWRRAPVLAACGRRRIGSDPGRLERLDRVSRRRAAGGSLRSLPGGPGIAARQRDRGLRGVQGDPAGSFRGARARGGFRPAPGDDHAD